MTKSKSDLFLVIALALFGVSLVLILTADPWRTTSSSTAISPNVMVGLASLGFALAGGLALIAAAIASRTPPGP